MVLLKMGRDNAVGRHKTPGVATGINLDIHAGFSYGLIMFYCARHRMLEITFFLVLSLCLSLITVPWPAGGGSSPAVSNIDVCDDDPSEILFGELFIAEEFYANLNFLSAAPLEINDERNDAAALVSRLERPPVN